MWMFSLAERLGRFVSEIEQSMTLDELKGWIAYNKIQRDTADKLRLEAEAKAGVKRAQHKILTQRQSR